MRASVTIRIASVVGMFAGAVMLFIAFRESQYIGYIGADEFLLGLGGIALFSVAGTAMKVQVPTEELKEKLRSLRPIPGKSRQEVSRALGKPTEMKRGDSEDLVRLTWSSPRLSVTLEFQDDVCTGVVHRKDES